MKERWKQIPEFPVYSVSNQGRVRNDYTDRIMARLVNQQGIVNVGLTKGREQHKRSLAILVAKAFVPVEGSPHTFDTPTHLDGDRKNCRSDNLVWRPRWFSIRYHEQFNNERLRGFKVPVEIIDTGERFPTSWEAAVKYGLIDREIMEATLNRTYVWPTYQMFRVIE